MNDISVDKKGLSFSFSILVAVVLVGALWSAWLPIHQSVFSAFDEDEGLVASVAEGRDAVSVAGLPPLNTETLSTFVYINLETGQIELIKNKEPVALFDILRLPNVRSPDSVPSGTYAVDKKSLVKSSTITLVRFPFYITFGDRYAIHAVPTDANGVERTEAFPGSKIELRKEDAEALYNFVTSGMPVVVSVAKGYRDDEQAQKHSLPYTDLPATSAQSYVLGDVETGEVYLSKHEDDRYPIASITKLITAAVATDIVGHGEVVEAPDGEYYTLSDLFYPLLLQSDNAVAKDIAVHAGEQYFLSNMNAYVHALEMRQSSFVDTSGLSPRNISSANDLFTFARHIYTDKFYLFDITHEESMTITSVSGRVWNVKNQNKLASDPHFQGGKLGFTDEAAQTSLAVFSVPIGDQTRPVAVIVLQSDDWKQDTRTLLRWLVEQAK